MMLNCSIDARRNLRCIMQNLRKSIRNAKRTYFEHIFTQHKNDIKKTWKILNETLSRSTKTKSDKSFQ